MNPQPIGDMQEVALLRLLVAGLIGVGANGQLNFTYPAFASGNGNAEVPSSAPIQPAQAFVDAVMAGYNPAAGVRVSGAVADTNANGDYAVAPATQYAGRRVWRSIANPDYWMFFDDDGWSIQINNTGTFDPAGGQVYFEDSADLTLGDMVPWLYSQRQQWLIAATDHDHDSLTLVFIPG